MGGTMNRIAPCSRCPNAHSHCILRDLDPDGLLALGTFGRSFYVKPKSLLYSSGFPADGIYILCSGSVKLFSESTGRGIRIAQLIHPGEVFGLDALLPSHTRRFGAMTLTGCMVHFIDHNRFSERIRLKADALWQLALMLDEEIHRSHEMRIAISGDHAQRRLYKAIVFLSRRQDADLPALPSWRPSLRQVDLSELVGLSQETVSRELRKLRERGVILQKNGSITLRSNSPRENRLALRADSPTRGRFPA